LPWRGFAASPAVPFREEAVTKDNNPKKKEKRAKIAPLLEGRIMKL